VEGRNGRNREIYNQPALEMAARYSLKTTGGSDAHAVDEIGTCVTVFESNIATDADLLNELKAGGFTSARFRARERWSWKEDTRTIERRWV
jgi:histidinol phosphatase-like PHP family hydrolase